MKKCPYCGHRNPDSAEKCSYCGYQFEKKTGEIVFVIFGVLLVAALLVGGFYAFRLAASSLDFSKESSIVKTEKTPVTAAPSVTAVPTPTAEPTPAPTQVPLTGLITNQHDRIEVRGYQEAAVSEVFATSKLEQPGLNASPERMLDGRDTTAWQEGVEGDGIGEGVTFILDQEYNVRFFIVKLGAWRKDSAWKQNNRPATLTFEVGDETFEMAFPDEKTEFCIELSRDVPASIISFRIDSVYPGTKFEDTVVTNFKIYGRLPENS